MRLRGLIAALFVTVASAGAGVAGAQSPGAQEAPDPAIADGSAQHALDGARARWHAAAIKNYQVRVALGCFCPPDITKPRTITVRHGVPRRPPSHLKKVATVPRMFAVIQDAIDTGVAGLTVRYAKRGVPRVITIDVSRMIADEESSYAIDHFRRLAG